MACAEDAPPATAACGGRIGRWLRTYDAFQLHAAICEAALPCPCRRCVYRDRRGTADLRARRAACLGGVRRIGARRYVILISRVTRIGSFSGASRFGGACIVGCVGGQARACRITRASRGACQPGVGRSECIGRIRTFRTFRSFRRRTCIGRFRCGRQRSRATRTDTAAPASSPVGRRGKRCDGARDRHAQALHAGSHAAPERARK
ncbi:hypothetical protein BCO71171_06891 [Burkholderia contaminans]|uniref:Uncharacterized protein n=1 Tax=Burkholderia contaminans TaxID=488447 RepID=A0A6P3BVQ2_9BURK|nr:hypothetical protein BCO71171_06891 [Burkholderia contaminans]